MKESTGLIDRAYRLGSHGKFQAEIRPGHDPKRCAVRVIPGQERVAAAHLIGRRFMVFLPEIECEPKLERDKRTNEVIGISAGKKLDKPESMYPGYIFVMIWDILFHWQRIKSCPGIIDFVCGENGPAVISDEVIEGIKAIENALRPLTVTAEMIGKKKRRWRRTRQDYQEIPENEIVSIRTWSAYRDGLGLDNLANNDVFQRALGLA